MSEVLEIGIYIISAVVITTAIYHILPFRKVDSKKPSFGLFPKYECSFSIPIEDVIKRVVELGFSLKPNSDYI